MSRLRQRNSCPSCGSFLGDEILSLAYETDPLRSFLAAYYPKINLSYLQGGVYSLRHCDYCHLIYQQGVPDDELARARFTRIGSMRRHQGKKSISSGTGVVIDASPRSYV